MLLSAAFSSEYSRYALPTSPPDGDRRRWLRNSARRRQAKPTTDSPSHCQPTSLPAGIFLDSSKKNQPCGKGAKGNLLFTTPACPPVCDSNAIDNISRGPLPPSIELGYSCASRKARVGIRRPRPGSARRVVAHYGLDFEELLESVLTPLATVARLLVAAERSPVIDGRAVQMHVAGANAPSDGLGAFRVA